jgi:hypothetical protein
MCQLLGMNCAQPTDFTFSLRGFCRRGGDTDIHSHGFGVCVHEGRGVRCFHDTLPASESPIAKLLQNYPLRTYVSNTNTPNLISNSWMQINREQENLFRIFLTRLFRQTFTS